MKMLTHSLILSIEYEGKKVEVELTPGSPIILGRSRECAIVFESPKVSKKHLEISWDGKTLQFTALESQNGTFRGIEQTEFHTAEFIVSKGDIDLQFSTIPVTIKWKPKQEFAPKERREPTTPLNQQKPKSSPKSQKVDIGFYFYFTLTLLGVLLLEILGTLYLGRKILFQGFNTFHHGAFKDFYLYIAGVITHQSKSLLFYFFSILLVCYFLSRFMSQRRKKYLPKTFAFPFQMASIVLPFALVFLIPVGIIFFSGFQIDPFNRDYFNFWKISRSSELNYNEKIPELKNLKSLEGSSLLYKEILSLQRKRVLTECNGKGMDKTWDDKKTCLILLTGVAAETSEDVKPALLGKVSAQIVTLSALDGLVRTLAVEGSETPTSLFFLSVLSELQFQNEVQEIEKVLANSDLTNQEKISALSVMRGTTELQVEKFQAEKKLPKSLAIAFPGPLESGI